MSDPVRAGFIGSLEVFVIQDEAGEGHMLLFLPDRNNDASQRERKVLVCYNIQERLRLARNAAHHAYEFRCIHFVGVFDKTTAGINKGDASDAQQGWTANGIVDLALGGELTA